MGGRNPLDCSHAYPHGRRRVSDAGYRDAKRRARLARQGHLPPKPSPAYEHRRGVGA